MLSLLLNIKCYFYFYRCCNLWWVWRGFFWIINLSVMCQYRYQKHAFYRSAINYILRSSKKNNFFWIVLCYSYIFHDLKRCPYGLKMRKQITKLDMNMTWNDKSGCPCLSHLFPVLISMLLKLASIPKQPLSELSSLSHRKIGYLLGYPTAKFIIWFRVRWRSKMQPFPVRKYRTTHVLFVTYGYWSKDWC